MNLFYMHQFYYYIRQFKPMKKPMFPEVSAQERFWMGHLPW
jgi:hypothetical protein